MNAALLVLAMLLDAALGEPDWLWKRFPHPAVLMGRAVDWVERRLNRGTRRKARGVLAMTGLGLAALGLGALIAAVPDFGLLEVIVAAIPPPVSDSHVPMVRPREARASTSDLARASPSAAVTIVTDVPGDLRHPSGRAPRCAFARPPVGSPDL